MPRGLEMIAPADTGLYGKIASQGDFINRRIPTAFVQVWDDWLQRCHAHCKEALGNDWERFYQSAPVWWFLLASGTCGESAWAGLVQPSVDRVGRFFPLTVTAELPPDVETLSTLAASREWFGLIEQAAEAAFHPDVSLEVLDARLLAIPFPAAALRREEGAEETLPIAAREITAVRIAASAPIDFVLLKAWIREQQIDVGSGHCVWLSLAPLGGECTLLITKGLPDPGRFLALMDGRWQANGWETQRFGSPAAR
jgi:type VI secretion system protein ImpM